MIMPVVSSNDIWKIAFSLNFISSKLLFDIAFSLWSCVLWFSFSLFSDHFLILTLLCPIDLIDALRGNLTSEGNDSVALPRVMHHCKGGCDLDPYEMIKPYLREKRLRGRDGSDICTMSHRNRNIGHAMMPQLISSCILHSLWCLRITRLCLPCWI